MAKIKQLNEQEMLESKNRFNKLLKFEPDKFLVEYSFVNKKEDLLLDEDDDLDPSKEQLNQNGETDIPQDNSQDLNSDPIQGDEPGGLPADGNLPQDTPPVPAPPTAPPVPAPAPIQTAPAPAEGGLEIDVTDLTNSQEDVESQVNNMTHQTNQMMDMLSKLADKVQGIVLNTDIEMAKIKDEIIKRNPTPVEVLQKRIVVSDPFNQTPADYWDKKQAEGHYKLEDDDKDETFELKSSDIDSNVSDIYKSFGLTNDEMNQSLGSMFKF